MLVNHCPFSSVQPQQKHVNDLCSTSRCRNSYMRQTAAIDPQNNLNDASLKERLFNCFETSQSCSKTLLCIINCERSAGATVLASPALAERFWKVLTLPAEKYDVVRGSLLLRPNARAVTGALPSDRSWTWMGGPPGLLLVCLSNLCRG